MCVNRRGARLKPDTRRVPGLGDCIAHNLGRLYARIKDDLAVLWSVTTVHALSREIDYRICAFDLGHPITERLAIPLHHAPRCVTRLAAEHNDFVAAFVKRAGEHRSYLTRTTGNDDLHF